MPTIDSYTPGTPSWVDLSTADPGAAEAFYGALFGWEFQRADDPAAGGYTMATRDGLHVAGIGPLMAPGQPPVWTTYVTVGDAEETAAKAQANGGLVVMPPADVLDVGRMAVLADREGALFAIWEPRAHAGAQLVNEPGSFCWNELWSRDPAEATGFYPTVFGWTPAPQDGYTEWQLGGRSIAGMLPMPPQVPSQVPAHWLVYFAVTDTDAVVGHTVELGGQVLVPPTDIPVGRLAVLSDPQGAVFAVITLVG